MSETDFPLPPPTFEFLVFSLKTQAEMQMGLYGFGQNDEDKDAGPNFPAARHAIDLLSMIAEKTKGNLSMEEQRLIENALTELRFRYVQVMEKSKASLANTEAVASPSNVEASGAAEASGSAEASGEPAAGS